MGKKAVLSGRNLRRIFFIVVLVPLITYWWWGSRAVIRYETTTIMHGDISASVVAVGTLYPQNSVEVGAQVSGQIVQLLVDSGSIVEEGQLLAEIDPSLQQATVDGGRAQLASQRAQLINSQAQLVLNEQQFERQQQLMLDNATREEAVQQATANLAAAKSNVAVLNANIEQTLSRLKGDEASLGYTRIYAPIPGTVLSLVAELGQTLNAAYSTPPVLTIADLSIMTAEVKVAEADIRYIKAGMIASFTTLGDITREWEGKVRQVLPAPPASSGTNNTVFYTVLFDVDNADGELMYGMTAQVSFITVSAKDVVVVPLSALQIKASKDNVYEAKIMDADGVIQTREVTIGSQDLLMAEILTGLEPGDELVIRTIEGKRRDG